MCSSDLEELRTKFDQIRPVIATNTSQSLPKECQDIPPTIETSEDLDNIPTVAILTHSPIKPTAHKNIMEYFDYNNPHAAQWRHTAFTQYDKNASYRVFTKPQPHHTIPDNIDILRSVLATTVKATQTKNLWLLCIRHCINGNPIKGKTKYGPTYAPTISPDTL